MAIHKRQWQRLFVLSLVGLLVCWPLPKTTQAAAGDLDPTFGTETLVITSSADGGMLVQAIAVQPDGKVIAAGSTGDFALARYNVDGTLDSSFGVGGQTTAEISRFGDSANGIALQPDGKIILVGYSEVRAGTDGRDFAVARFKADGSLDTTFGDGGKVTTDFFGLYDAAAAVALQPDGKIIAAGSTVNTSEQFALARYNVDGSLDAGFGIGGKLTTNSPGFGSVRVSAVSLQPDGKIIAAGYGFTSMNADFALVRYNADGSLDSTFGTGGKVNTDFFGRDDAVVGLALGAGGKILVAGRATKGTSTSDDDYDFGIARYDNNGALDSSFGSAGKVTTDFSSKRDLPHSMAVQLDGKIVVVGSCIDNGVFFNSALARYNTDGSLDFTFGTGGKVITSLGGTIETYAVTVQPDNKIVTGSSYLGCTLIRYNSDGSRDFSFRSRGKTTTDFAGRSDQAFAVAVQPDGKIIVAGSTETQPNVSVLAFARYNVGGDLDPSFGAGGKATAAFGGQGDIVFAIILQPDGKIVAGGRAASAGFGLIRLNSNGSVDTSFGSQGKVTTQFPEGPSEIRALALQPDGDIVAVGYTGPVPPAYKFALARYSSNGSLDPSFGTGGRVTTDLTDKGDAAYAVGVQPNGKIVVAGNAENDNIFRIFGVARYNSDGSLDAGFGKKGKITNDILGRVGEARALAIQPSGKVIVAGYTESNNPFLNEDFALVRYNNDGSLDSTFGTGGFVVTDFYSRGDFINAIVLTPGGKIIAAGTGTKNNNADFGLAAYKDDGSLDSSFGIGGKVTTSFGIIASATALALAPDGRIVAAGTTTPFQSPPDFALARYEALPGSGGGSGAPPPFDICVQNDSTGDVLEVNSETGDYRFSSCGSQRVTLTGKAKVKVKKAGCLLKLSASLSDHALTASINICKKTGSASIEITATGRVFELTDGDITNNTCACP